MPISRLTITEKLVVQVEGVLSKQSMVFDPITGDAVEELKIDVNCLYFDHRTSSRSTGPTNPVYMTNTPLFMLKYQNPACS